jgi:hypothetical protein
MHNQDQESPWCIDGKQGRRKSLGTWAGLDLLALGDQEEVGSARLESQIYT